VTYALHKTKFYTLGLDKLTICVDHKPLIGILNDTELEIIENRRIRKLKEKTLGWRFKIIHVPGSKIEGTYALSRNAIASIAICAAEKEMRDHFGLENEHMKGQDHETGIMKMVRLLRMAKDSKIDDCGMLGRYSSGYKSSNMGRCTERSATG